MDIPGGVQGRGDRKMPSTLEAFQDVKKDNAQESKSEQVSAKKSAQVSNAQTTTRSKTNKTKGKRKSLQERARLNLKKMKDKKKLLPVERIKDKAKEHSQKNPELKSKVLQLLRERIKPDAKAEDIQNTLDEFYPDPTLADDAMDFLLDTTEGGLHNEVNEAKEEHNEAKGREIQAGRNISIQARKAADKGLGTATSMREMYRDVTGNPRNANTMFQELTQKYAYKEMQKVTKFLLHSMGADMKAKGPSIPRGELHNLLTEVRTIQAILGVYRFFNGRMSLVNKMFKQHGLQVPKKLNFESMAKAFMDLAGERYPSADKVMSQSKRLGVDQVPSKIIAFSQFRDSVRDLAMSQVYRSVQHRDEVFNAIIEALEDLEDELEEIEEMEEMEEMGQIEDYEDIEQKQE